jgi:predicted RNA-binding Zn-ribbon protein involved in translation (DUF1610 family)
MTLSCSCDTDGGDEFSWYYTVPKDYSKLTTKRRKRCSSCNTLIDVGATSLRFYRHRPPKWEIEEKIWGEDGEIEIASMYHCEACADMYFNLRELGFECIAPDEDVRKLVREYQAIYLKKETVCQ